MIISHSHKFIYLHTPKTGGTSLTRSLIPYIYCPDVDTNQIIGTWSPELHIDGEMHTDLNNLKSCDLLRDYSNYFKFAFIRNPYDWVFSWYLFGLRRSINNGEVIIRGSNPTKKGFIAFVESLEYDIGESGTYNLYKPQHTYLYLHNQLVVNYIARYKRYEKEIDHIAKMVGVKNLIVPRLNIGNFDRHNCMDYYSTKCRTIISKIYHDDFSRFEYKVL